MRWTSPSCQCPYHAQAHRHPVSAPSVFPASLCSLCPLPPAKSFPAISISRPLRLSSMAHKEAL